MLSSLRYFIICLYLLPYLPYHHYLIPSIDNDFCGYAFFLAQFEGREWVLVKRSNLSSSLL